MNQTICVWPYSKLWRDKLMNTNRQYWAFRVHNHKDLYAEIKKEDRLRQGWGSRKGQDLRKITGKTEDAEDGGARSNLRMFREVKKGDILLVALPDVVGWNKIAVVEAKANWNTAYKFEIHPAIGDCGHIFPVKYIKEFDRDEFTFNKYVRRSFYHHGRFWSLVKYGDYIEEILNNK